jgi:hypothetical protein
MAESPDALVHRLVDDILGPAPRRSDSAWEVLSLLVVHQIRYGTFLLAELDDDDDGGRRAVAAGVVEWLAREGHDALREWSRRQRRSCDQSSWDMFVRVVALHEARAYLDSRRFELAPGTDGDHANRERQ